MNSYRLSKEAEIDLIQIYHYGVNRFGSAQAEKYYNSLFDYFEVISQRPFSFESVDYIRLGYRRSVFKSHSIYFRVNKEFVEIMAIVGKQDLNDKL